MGVVGLCATHQVVARRHPERNFGKPPAAERAGVRQRRKKSGDIALSGRRARAHVATGRGRPDSIPATTAMSEAPGPARQTGRRRLTRWLARPKGSHSSTALGRGVLTGPCAAAHWFRPLRDAAVLANYGLLQTRATNRWVVRQASGISASASRAQHGKAPCSRTRALGGPTRELTSEGRASCAWTR